MSTTQELVTWLRNYARALQTSGEPTHGNDEGFNLAAARLSEQAAELEALRGKLAQADAMRKLINTNLSEYIDAEGGTVDVTIALAFEATRDTP